ncbi:MAG: carboxypeptidase-like regulatory domain-containing protein [Gemmatimonadota bacterium]|uniref:TonB-dependent receptor n=1 Tax=Candidatus Palauibacter scopulicola TaxID=3056741 RepID=UPI00238378CD|nr:carboxypeptidase-like regulatory domain-containing protein [Candidatus Palauibacter scopulicola]MDE2663408.1 carboxypeptidase-like regulatory domain-containing protein [Candidatus Palauibacter scopulicola]
MRNDAGRMVRAGSLAAWMLAFAVTAGGGSLAALQEDGCGGRESLAVEVLDDSGLVPIPGATVALRWTDAERRPVREPVGADGQLVLCVPPNTLQGVLWAEFGDASSEEMAVTVEPGAAVTVQLRLLFGSTATGRVIGQVRDARNDRPVAAAAVSVPGRTEAAQSNSRGYFVLSALPVGEHELSVRHLGYAPLVHRVAVERGVTTEAMIGLSPDPVVLAPLVAVATRSRRLEISGFYERREWGELTGGGEFFTVEDIERRNPLRISHMIADVPGVRLGNCGVQAHGCQLYGTRASAGFGNQGCKLNIFVDGNLVIRGSDERWAAEEVPPAILRMSRMTRENETINDYVLPAEIEGLEVYTGAAVLPAEFSGYDARCGAVVIWTK